MSRLGKQLSCPQPGSSSRTALMTLVLVSCFSYLRELTHFYHGISCGNKVEKWRECNIQASFTASALTEKAIFSGPINKEIRNIASCTLMQG